MALKRRAFVVALGKSKADIEATAYKLYLEGKAPIPDANKLATAKGVRRSAKGIVVDTRRASENVSGLVKIVQAAVVHPAQIHRQNVERLALIKQLSELGFRVAVPKFVFSDEKLLQRVKPHARVFKANAPVIAQMGSTKEYASSSFWLRDMWSKLGDKRVKRYDKGSETAFGEGGMMVHFGKTIFASDKLRNDPQLNKAWDAGYKVYFLKDGEQYYPSVSRMMGSKIYVTIDHVDLFLGVAGKTLLVEQDFFAANEGTLRRAAKDNKLKVCFVPREEADFHPANFLVLGENKVLMDKQARKTIELLRAQGVEVVPTRTPMKANLSAGGGVRCIANEL